MSMGIFQGLDVASAADDPFSVDDGTYYATVSKCSVETAGNGSKGLTFEYTIHDAEDEKFNGRKTSEWKTIPEPIDDRGTLDEKGQQHLSFLKQRLKSLGVPDSEMNEISPEDLLGIEVIITLRTTTSKKDGMEYQNVRSLKLADDFDNSVTGFE
jgi:hypothetical protein